MLIQLPAETWIEILDWLRRRDLVKKLDKLWDSQFTPIVQDWLHKYTRNVSLGNLVPMKDGLNVWSWVSRNSEDLPYTDVELPRNVTNFKQITLSYLDSAVLAFLQQVQPLFHKIHLMLDEEYEGACLTQAQTTLRALMPMINSIETLTLDCVFLQFFSTNFPSALSNVKVLQIKLWWNHVLADEFQQILIDWLFAKRNDGGAHARILTFWRSNDHDLSGFCEKIRQRFLDPVCQCAACHPFFVRIPIREDRQPNMPPDMDVQNVQTGEQLTFKTVENDSGTWRWRYKQITNCPTRNATNSVEWLANKKTEEEVIKWDSAYQQRRIWLPNLERKWC